MIDKDVIIENEITHTQFYQEKFLSFFLLISKHKLQYTKKWGLSTVLFWKKSKILQKSEDNNMN